MLLLRLFVFISILGGIVECEVYRQCDTYSNFCLFSFGSNTTVKELAEAGHTCTNARSGSWVYNTTDPRMEHFLWKFFEMFFFPGGTKVILSNKGEDKEIIVYVSIEDIEDGKQQYNIRKVNNTQLKHNHMYFAVVCAIGCYSDWETFNNSQYEGGEYYGQVEIKSKDECQNLCETTRCKAFEWDSREGCFIHKEIKGDRKENPNRTLYIIKRTVKTVDKCIGDLTAPITIIHEDTTQTGVGGEGGGSRGLWAIPVSLLIIIIIIVIAVIWWKKHKKRNEISNRMVPEGKDATNLEQVEFLTSTEINPRLNLSNEPQRERELNYVVVDHDQFKKKDEVRGPRGDIYTPVVKGNKYGHTQLM